MFKNLFASLRHYKIASLLNILGLGVAFAAFTLIMIQVTYEYGYGRSDKDQARIFRFEEYDPLDGVYKTNVFFPLINAFSTSSPDIESYAQLLYSTGNIKIAREGQESLFFDNENVTYLFNDPGEVFDIEMMAGTMASALEPATAVVSESQARRLFGSDTDPMGQQFQFQGRNYTVGGVYRDLPDNATLKNAIYLKGRELGVKTLFVKLRDPDKASAVIDNFKTMTTPIEYGYIPSESIARLTPVAEAYFQSQMSDNSFISSGSRPVTNMLLAIAILVIVIAGINFINFSTAVAPLRVRALNTRLVLGDTVWGLRRLIMFEAVIIALLAFVLGMALVYQFTTTSLQSMIRVPDASMGGNVDVVLIACIIALVVGLVAGIYPAYYNTRFEPAIVLKGSLGAAPGSRGLRTALVGFQYVISIALIVGALYVREQNRFMLSAPLGYDRSDLLTLDIPFDVAQKSLASVKERMRQIPGVMDVSDYNGSFGVYDCDAMGVVVAGGDTLRMNSYYVGVDFRRVMRIPLVAGRDFSPEAASIDHDDPAQIPEVIINVTAAQRYGAAVDSLLNCGGRRRMRVVGITDDYISRSISKPIEPTSLMVTPYNNSILLLRARSENLDQTMAAINAAILEFVPENAPTVEMYDKSLSELYDKEQALGELIAMFSLLAVAIALMGVFGLVLFETQSRRTEITLRKIHGATVTNILGMFNSKFAGVVLICFVLAAPLTWWGVSQWLSGFAVQTSFQWWIFAWALLVVLGVTTLVVTLQSWHAATENPVKSLRNN